MTIVLRTQQELIDTALTRWIENNRYADGIDEEAELEMAMRFAAFQHPTAQDVISILGYADWVLYECGQCHEYVPEVLELDVRVYYREGKHQVCRKCLETALGGAK